MGKVLTERLDTSEGVVIEVPAFHDTKPTARAEDLWNRLPLKNRENWKLPPKSYATTNKATAVEVADLFDYYLGGHEFKEWKDEKTGEAVYEVSSHGYYFYVGS